jgi:hypothetical protein
MASGQLELVLESLSFNGRQVAGAAKGEHDNAAVPAMSIAGANSVRPSEHPLDGVTVLLEVLGPPAGEGGRGRWAIHA